MQNSADDECAQTVKSIIYHPYHDPNSLENGISLIELNSAVAYAPIILYDGLDFSQGNLEAGNTRMTAAG